MKQVLIALVVGIGAALLFAPHAEASSFMTITVGLSSVTCNNSTAASLAACPVGFTALTSEETITTAVGFLGSFTGSTDLTPASAPEPSSLVLLGTGLLIVAGSQFRKSRNRK